MPIPTEATTDDDSLLATLEEQFQKLSDRALLRTPRDLPRVEFREDLLSLTADVVDELPDDALVDNYTSMLFVGAALAALAGNPTLSPREIILEVQTLFSEAFPH